MINYELKLKRYLENITEKGKEQIIRFLLNKNKENRLFIMKQIEEFNKMYGEISKWISMFLKINKSVFHVLETSRIMMMTT